MITYDYYRIFYFVARYKSFTKAAKMLGNNQPNITRCMNILEQELKCTLFLRSNRGISLTPEGKKLYEHVAIAYEQLQIGEEEIRQNGELENGLVSIGASENALRLVLLSRLEKFHEQYPHVRLRISNHSTPQAIQALRSDIVDFAAVTTPLDIKSPLEKIPLASYREILIGGRKYKKLAEHTQKLEDIASLPFISLDENSSTRELYNSFFLEQGLSFAPDMEPATTDQMLPLITHNLGIGFYPKKMAELALTKGDVYQIPLEEKLPLRRIYLVTNGSTAKSTAVRKMIKFIQEYHKI